MTRSQASDAAIDLTRALIRQDSTNPVGRERAVAELLAEYATGHGLRARVDEVAPDRANILLTVPGERGSRRLLYCGHLDTVPIGSAPWTRDPFGGDLVDGTVWGRGAVDMKSGVAAMVCALIALRDADLPFGLTFAGVVGEEVDCVGSTHLLAHGGMDDVAWLVVAEPTNLDVVPAHKGATRVRVRARGRAAHGSKPELGVNAIAHMATFVTALSDVEFAASEHPLLTGPTCSANTISGGSAINVVPDTCELVLDVRTVPGLDRQGVLDRLDEVVRATRRVHPDADVTLEVIGDMAPVGTALEHPLVTTTADLVREVIGCVATRGVTYFSDASVLQPPTGVPTVLFGPGDDALAHQVDERVSAADVAAATEVLTRLPVELAREGAGVAGSYSDEARYTS